MSIAILGLLQFLPERRERAFRNGMGFGLTSCIAVRRWEQFTTAWQRLPPSQSGVPARDGRCVLDVLRRTRRNAYMIRGAARC
jgi:hypothetical protein